MIVEFVFVLFHISDGVFLNLILTFLESFCLLYNLIPYLSGFQSGLRQNKYCSCDNTYDRALLLSCGQSFPPVFSVVFKNATGMYDFRH